MCCRNGIQYKLKHYIIRQVSVVYDIYSVLVSVSCQKALYHLESDNLFCITVVVADWLG